MGCRDRRCLNELKVNCSAGALVFFDFGRTEIIDPVSTEKDSQTLYSVGVGLAFENNNRDVNMFTSHFEYFYS